MTQDKKIEALIEALQEVMAWIDNWEPSFVHDEEWQTTQNLVDIALEQAKASS